MELRLNVNNFDLAIIFMRVLQDGRRYVLPITILHKYNHQQVRVPFIDLLQVLFSPKVNIEPPVHICLVGEVIVLEIVEFVKDLLVEDGEEEVLFLPE